MHTDIEKEVVTTAGEGRSPRSTHPAVFPHLSAVPIDIPSRNEGGKPVTNKSKVAALMAVMTAFALAAAIIPAPTALAGQSEVFFSDVNGNPKAQWSIGETLYVTVVAHNENRDDAKVEFIDASKECQTHTEVSVPCIEVWNPNTKDSETNYGSLVLVETGSNSGIFRSQNGLQLQPFEGSADIQENGTVEAYNGDTLAVRYQGPSDDTDVSLDLAKVGATDATVRLTNQAGESQPMWRLGQRAYVTVEDADANLDPQTPDTLKGVTLWNPRCVWNALERGGSPRSDQPEPKPCEGTIAYDSALKNILDGNDVQVADSLVLEETGPDTGVFRNVNGVQINDNFAEQGERQLFVNHKDTITAYYRHPAIVSGQAPDGPDDQPETRTDSAENENFVFERTYPTSVQPGETFTVTVDITVKQDTQAAVLREGLPSGFSVASGNLRTVETSLSSGESFTHTYEVTAGPTPGSFDIRGVALDGTGVRPLPLTSTVSVGASGQAATQGLSAASVSAQAENSLISFTRSVSGNPAPGSSFTVNVNVEAKQSLEAVTVSDSLPSGLTLASGDTRAVELGLASGDSFSNSYTAQCPAGGGSFTINGEATPATGAGSQTPLSEQTTVDCSEGNGNGDQPTGATGFFRGGGGYNDPQDFAMAQAKVGHLNPANLTFTDGNGNEVEELEFGQDVFLTMEDQDQNIDTDHVETICVQVFDPNGGREGDTPAFHRQLQDQLKNDPRSCLEDHGREFQTFKTGVKLVETGEDTGVFRNPNALALIPICARSEEAQYGFATAPGDTSQVPIHFAENPGTNNVSPSTFQDVDPWWQKVNPGEVLKDCHPSTPYVEEGRAEFDMDPKTVADDVPGHIAAHAGDSLYAVYQDQVVDPHDVTYATAEVASDHTFTGEENALQFVDSDGNPVEDGQYQVGRDIFVRLEDSDRNVDSDINDKLFVLVLDRTTGDWENVLLTETGPDTGVFMSDAGLFLQPATSPDEVEINNNRLEVFDRDSIEAHYQDNYNAKDYTNTFVRLVPQPEGGPTGGPTPGDGQASVAFTDAQGSELANAAIGDDVYVTIEAPDTSGGTLTVTVSNSRTQESVEVSASNTSGNTYRTDAISTGAPGTDADIAVASGDTLNASYQGASDSLSVMTAEFNFEGATNFPNPLQTTTTFQAEGTGVASVTVNVYDLSGNLLNSASASGNSVMWDGTTAEGASLSGGVYLYTVTAEGRDGTTATSDVMKLVILR